MSHIDITYGTPVKIVTTINDLLVRNGKNFSDITDAIYMLKGNRSDTDEAAVFSKDYKANANLTINQADESIEVNLIPSDYGATSDKIQANFDYLVCIGVEFNDSGYYIEDYDPKMSNKIRILYDKVRK